MGKAEKVRMRSQKRRYKVKAIRKNCIIWLLSGEFSENLKDYCYFHFIKVRARRYDRVKKL